VNLRVYSLLAAAAATTAVATAATRTSQASLPSHPLTFGSIGATEIFGAGGNRGLAVMRRAGMSTVAVSVSWRRTAPQRRPSRWNPSDPNDSHYRWSKADAQITRIAKAGFRPVVIVSDAPTWARLSPGSSVSPPKTADFGAFMHALAARYSGSRGRLPRVRYWQIWNEPNISLFFAPQFDARTKKFTSPDVYRDMVNAAAASIHSVHSDNVAIAGSLAPFRDITPGVQKLDSDWGPLSFMRSLLCVDAQGRSTCSDKVTFDVWATHPYTSGGPTHHAQLPNDVSLGDLPKMRATLGAAIKAGHIRSKGTPQFWANEFSWDSNPPDACSPPMSLLERWIPEAFYRMWANGIDSISWFKLMDDPMRTSFYQSGLVFHAPSFARARPKPYLEAFRFPFVALQRGAGVYVWAHTPFGRPSRVAVQQSSGHGWKTVAVLRADRYGIAQSILKAKPSGRFRAILGRTGEKSLPFSMRVPPDRFFNPFGEKVLLEPHGKVCKG
jgi:hypothetical protein